jgi:HlyD family secretion protein
MFKKIFFAIIIIGVIGAVVWSVKFREPAAPEYVTEIVEFGTLTQSVEATGKVESMDRIELNFRTSGRINEMKVAVGDVVRLGDVLSRLDNRALLSRVSDAQAQVDKEKADYNKLIAGASQQDIQVTQDTVSQKQQDLTAAKNTVINLNLKKNTELSNLKETAITTLKNEIVVADAALEEVDNTLDDPDASYTLGIQDSNAVNNAENSMDLARISVDDTSGESSQISTITLNTDVLNVIDSTMNSLGLVKESLDDTMTVLLSTITSSYLSESELDTLKTNIQAQQTKISTSQVSLVTAKTNWTNRIVYFDDQIATAQDAVNQTDSALKVTQSQLELKQSPPRKFEIDAQKARVAQAESSVSLALANLEDATIRAPMNGTITKKHYEAGEQTSITSPVLEMIGNATLAIEVDIPESDISKITTSQIVKITLDAFGDEKVYNGSVTFVDPAETLISDVVYYKVKVAFSDSGLVKPGMTANVTIVADEKENVLFVPFRAVKTDNGDKYVEIIETGFAKERVVTVGLRGDEGIEIISGIEAGDEVITFVKEK